MTSWIKCRRKQTRQRSRWPVRSLGISKTRLDLSEFTDEYQAELRRVIDAKVAGEEVVVTEDEAPAKVVDLMDALRKSLDSVSKSKKKPAKAIEKRAAPRKRKRA